MIVPPAAKKLRSDGFEALKQQRDAAAAELLSRYLDTVPDDVEAELALAVARSGQGKHAAALAIFERHLERDPKSPVLHFNRATTLERLGRKIDAVQAYELVLRLNPDHAKARLRLDALRGTTAKSVGGPQGDSSDNEDMPLVIPVDEDGPTRRGRQTAGKDRWIHPAGLVAIIFYVAALIGIAAYTMATYQAGGCAGGILFSALMLLAGVQAIHRGRHGDKRYPMPVGYVLAALGVVGLVNVSGFMVFYLTTVDWQQMKRAREQQAILDDLRKPRQPRVLSAEELAKARTEMEKRQKEFHAKQVMTAIDQLKHADKNDMLLSTMRIAGLSPEEGDPRAELAVLLEGLLTQKDSTVRYWAIHALAAWGSRDTISKLKPFLTDRDGLVRSEAKKTVAALEKQP